MQRTHCLVTSLLIRAALALLALPVPGLSSSILQPGVGSFSFPLPRSGQVMTVHYVMDARYNPADPPVMVLHGMLRNADEYRDAWIDLASEHHFLVLAPEFSEAQFPGTEGYNLGNLYRSESDLTPLPEALWSYPVVGELFDYLKAHDLTRSDGYVAFGHSAGSQYLHRAQALFPDPRLHLVVAANAGWYTFPDLEVSWPYGLQGTRFKEADFAVFLQSRLVILLGNADTDPHHASLRRTPEAMRQGSHRLLRGQAFLRAGQDKARKLGVPFAWRLQIVDGVEHNNKGMAPTAAQLMAAFMHPAARSVEVESGE